MICKDYENLDFFMFIDYNTLCLSMVMEEIVEHGMFCRNVLYTHIRSKLITFTI